MDNLKQVRQQGRDAKTLNEGEGAEAGALSAHSCPYGPGEMRDAWLAGFGGQGETVEQVDTSTQSSDDIRTETPKTVKEGAKPRGSKNAKDQAAKAATTVSTQTTGTGETALKTVVVPTNPELSDQVPTPETVVGDPAASTNPVAVKPADLM
jgi:hypothetical protein